MLSLLNLSDTIYCAREEMAYSSCDPAFSIADPNGQEGDVDGRI
ncbi:hypothetical protein [Candidatus Methanodesulfokora washburnensis]|nr:hypothetical protein [Candidatus Methanodesulfokores washburnensis]